MSNVRITRLYRRPLGRLFKLRMDKGGRWVASRSGRVRTVRPSVTASGPSSTRLPSESPSRTSVPSEASWPQSSIQTTGKCSAHRYCKCHRVHHTRVSSYIRSHSPADGPSKNAFESLQKQIDFHMGESYRLRRAQNSYAIVSRLPEELLAEVFSYIVESGIQDIDSSFATGTFSFLQACRYWNEVAVGFPQLWRWWTAGAVKAWPLFHSRSKDIPLSLTWRPRLTVSALADINPGIPKRIRQLDFKGTGEQLAQLLSVFDSTSSNISSLRLQISPYDSREPREGLVHFLSSSFPKLSQLAFVDFLPDPLSPVFTTTSLTSLKLSVPYQEERSYTLSQFSQILQRHQNLQELDLSRSAVPLPGQSSPSIPLILPRLVSLRLYGPGADILGLTDLIDMSSPLHNVVIRFCHDLKPGPGLAKTVEKIIGAYYGCQGLNHPREVHHLTVLHNPEARRLVFHARSHPGLTPDLSSSLKLQYNGIYHLGADTKEIFPPFPLNSVRQFTAEGPAIYGDQRQYRGMLQKMKDLSHLRLNKQDISLILSALRPGNQSSFRVMKTVNLRIRAQINRTYKPPQSWSR